MFPKAASKFRFLFVLPCNWSLCPRYMSKPTFGIAFRITGGFWNNQTHLRLPKRRKKSFLNKVTKRIFSSIVNASQQQAEPLFLIFSTRMQPNIVTTVSAHTTSTDLIVEGRQCIYLSCGSIPLNIYSCNPFFTGCDWLKWAYPLTQGMRAKCTLMFSFLTSTENRTTKGRPKRRVMYSCTHRQ